MGVVYEGLDPNIGRRVAIKTARRDVLDKSPQADEMMQRFLREAQAAGALNHPNIITIYDADEQDGIAYIAMEFLEGGDLRDVLEKKQRLGVEQIVQLGATLCDALASAHDRGVVHRDIKPANILMPRNAPVKLADFGIAHMQDSTLTQEGSLIGTPYYMSPEQFMGQKVDGRSDLFSVAVLLYELMTGEKPFTGEALSTVMHHVIKTDPVPPLELNFSLPPALSCVILRAMSKRPADRYQDGRAMAAALIESVRPNPDPAVLGVSLDVKGTGGRSPVEQEAATVLTPPPYSRPHGDIPADAATLTPLPSAPAQPAESGAERTGAGKTVMGSPPPGVSGLDAMPELIRRKRIIFVGTGIGALAVILALVFTLSGGGDTGKTNGVDEPSDPARAVMPEKYFRSVAMTVYVTKDMSTKTDYDDALNALGPQVAKQRLKDLYAAGQVEAFPALVIVSDGTGKTLARQVISDSGGTIQIPEPRDSVVVKIWVPKSGESPDTIPTDTRPEDGNLTFTASTAAEELPMQDWLVIQF